MSLVGVLDWPWGFLGSFRDVTAKTSLVNEGLKVQIRKNEGEKGLTHNPKYPPNQNMIHRASPHENAEAADNTLGG